MGCSPLRQSIFYDLTISNNRDSFSERDLPCHRDRCRLPRLPIDRWKILEQMKKQKSGVAIASRGAAERLLSEDRSIAGVAVVIEATCSVVLCSFTQAILHGDETHRRWLQEACDAFISGEPMPPPRDAKTSKL